METQVCLNSIKMTSPSGCVWRLTPPPLKGGDDCLDSVKVYLKDPLGDRVIIDDHTNRAITLSESVQ